MFFILKMLFFLKVNKIFSIFISQRKQYIYYKRKLISKMWFEPWNSQSNEHLCKPGQAVLALGSNLWPHPGSRQRGAPGHTTTALYPHSAPQSWDPPPGVLSRFSPPQSSPHPLSTQGLMHNLLKRPEEGASEQLLNPGPGFLSAWDGAGSQEKAPRTQIVSFILILLQQQTPSMTEYRNKIVYFT